METTPTMRLQLMTWPDIQDHLAHSRAALVPIGSTEQHGPTGLIGTDALCAEAIADRVGEACGALVAPVIAVGMAVHHMAFPGTLTLRPTTLIAVIQDVVDSLADHGFERVFFINGHGGNVPTLRTAFMEIHAIRRRLQRPELCLASLNWWEGKRTRALCRTLYGDREGAHATPSEVAVTWALHPDRVRDGTLNPPVAPIAAFQGPVDYRDKHPDGRMGSDPSLAKAEDGVRILETAVAEIAEAFRRFADA